MGTEVMRAADVSSAQSDLGVPTALLGQALGLLDEALAVVDGDGTILFATAAAETILRGGEGSRVRELLRRGWTRGDGPRVDLEVPRLGRPPVSLRAQPLGEAAGTTLVALHDPELEIRVDVLRLAAIYALTPTEALVAAAIAEGKTLASFSSARGCSEQTVRTHLKRVLNKMGCARQADLVRLALSNPLLRQRAPAPPLHLRCL